MKKMKCAVLVAMAISTLLAACDSDNPEFPVVQRVLPPPPLAWDQGNWDDVLWQ